MTSKPNVLVFGGIGMAVPCLLRLVVPDLPAEPLVSYVRIVDKYSIDPPTTYIPKNILKKFRERPDVVEYRQANLKNKDVVSKAINDAAPNGQPFTYVVDSTGDITPGRPAEVYIANTFNVSLLVGHAVANYLSQYPGSIKAYIRWALPWYKCTDIKKRYKEEDPEGWKPRDQRCVWWHESIRAVGSIEGLPLCVLRVGMAYGEGFTRYELAALTLLGLVYKYLGEEMKLLWSPDLPKNSINNADIAGIAWAAANWMSTRSRSEANVLIGACLPPSQDESAIPQVVPNVIPASAGSVLVPVFNMVDEADSTQASLSATIGQIFDIKVGFQGAFKGLLAGMKMAEVAEEANTYHLQAWNEIILRSNPPVPETPLSPYLPQSVMEEDAVGFNGEKIRTVLQYQYQYPRPDERAIRDFINWARSEGIWPESDLYMAA